jgi:hypothetical protein
LEVDVLGNQIRVHVLTCVPIMVYRQWYMNAAPTKGATMNAERRHTWSKAAPRNVDEMRHVAAQIVEPIEADWNKIALFAATGEIEAGVARGVRDHIEQDPHPVMFADDLADYLEREEAPWALDR